jgi:nicotinate-nucleotide adenylyltransferase
MRPIGIFGGTFDPIHFGHLRAAFELGELLDLERVLFVPAADPPHRSKPIADAAMRLAMLRAAVADEDQFEVDEREFRRGGPSYTVLTLEELRHEHGTRPLVLMLGMDAFLGLPAWHRAGQLLELAHVAVAHRPGAQLPSTGELGRLLAERRAAGSEELAAAPAGRIFVHPGTQLDISSTDLREALRQGRDPRYLMPEPVRRMINAMGIYTRQGEAQG